MLFFIELTKFAAQFNQNNLEDEMSKWLFLLKNIGQMDEQDSSRENRIFRKFFETCQLSKLTTMEKEDYAKSILEYQEVRDTIEYEREYARAEGRAEGLAEGEVKAKLAMAKSMLEKGIDIDTIISITGLTAEEIVG